MVYMIEMSLCCNAPADALLPVVDGIAYPGFFRSRAAFGINPLGIYLLLSFYPTRFLAPGSEFMAGAHRLMEFMRRE